MIRLETAFEYWYGDLLFLSDGKFILEDLTRESLLIYQQKIPFRSNTRYTRHDNDRYASIFGPPSVSYEFTHYEVSE